MINRTQCLILIGQYAQKRIFEQIKAIALIVLYLFSFQTIILKIPVHEAGLIAFGLVLVVFGLAFFMEGLKLGLMPLGEVIGVKFPQKSSVPVILIFAFILGVGATFAEPAIGVLKTAGALVKAWEAPLLFAMLGRYSYALVLSVAVGVGFAVTFGMLRLIHNWSLKPFVYCCVFIAGSLSISGLFNDNMAYITGLAWDCGAVTTGPVTVPLVLALGIGLTRVFGDTDSSGFGVVTLASAFPIISVLCLGLGLVSKVPDPMSKKDFFTQNQAQVAGLFSDSDQYLGYMLKHADHLDQLSYFGGEKALIKQMNEIFADDLRVKKIFPSQGDRVSWIASLPLDLRDQLNHSSVGVSLKKISYWSVLKNNFQAAMFAVIPLAALLIFTLLFLLREPIRPRDEVFLGLGFAVIGMALFGTGIELGLAKIGGQLGGKLPATYQSISLKDQKKTFDNFNLDLVHDAQTTDGARSSFFFSKSGEKVEPIVFDRSSYNREKNSYVYTPQYGPLFAGYSPLVGIFVVLLFAFFMGYSATLAEPALNALGDTVEKLTVGAFRKNLLMQSVAVGVATGMAMGVAKIVWDVPLFWMLVPPYAVLLVLTFFSSEEFVNFGWDSAGVTTGPITVPLVIAMGLGIGGVSGVVEGFGILSLASVYPILSVLLVGLIVKKRAKI